MATYVTATAVGCLHKRWVAVRSEHIRPHYVKYASANFYTGISETVVVVGVQRLFVAMLVLAWLFGCVAKRNRQCAKSLGSIATKSMTVKNGGNTIDAVEGLALWVSHCISRACGLTGGLH